MSSRKQSNREIMKTEIAKCVARLASANQNKTKKPLARKPNAGTRIYMGGPDIAAIAKAIDEKQKGPKHE